MDEPGALPAIDRIVVATDGSESVTRAVSVALDLAARFDAEVHALSVVDTDEVDAAPDQVRESLESALSEQAATALEVIADRATVPVVTAVREGSPADTIVAYADEVDADVVAAGTRGRHGEHRFLLGSVAERLVRTCPVPVLTVRQLEGAGITGGAPVAGSAEGQTGDQSDLDRDV